jgi:hypothetical protein
MGLQKFTIKRFKKNGQEMPTVKVKSGFWVEPHNEKKDGFIYYPGTMIPSINFMEVRKYDKFNQLKGGPPPWCDPKTIEINKELLETEDIYDKLLKAKKENDLIKTKFLSRPLVSWRCPMTLARKNMYSQGVTISNRNDKCDYVYDNLERFDIAVEKLKNIYNKEYINSVRGQAALINLLSAKFCFRVGNVIDKNSGKGITTLLVKHVSIDEKNRMHFNFQGKKNVRWHKIFVPENEIEQKMYNGLKLLTERKLDNEFVFTVNGERLTSHEANVMFSEVLEVKDDEKEYLTFHSWRHRAASVAFKKAIDNVNLNKVFKKIDKSKSLNKRLKKARLINREINELFKSVGKLLNDNPGTVKGVYAGGKIFREFYEKNDIPFDEKKRNFDKEKLNVE